MKIDKSAKPLPPARGGDVPARTSTAAKQATTASQLSSGSGTNVHLGATSAHLLSIENSMANTPVVDVVKVAEIKQAISEGRFHVNSAVVADQLIESVKELINTQKSLAPKS